MIVRVCVPWRDGDKGRREGWTFNERRWRVYRWDIATGDRAGRFNRGAARNVAADGPWDIAVFADACIIPPSGTEEAVKLCVATGKLVHAHGVVHRLTWPSTLEVLRGADPSMLPLERSTNAIPPGGVLVVRRDAWDRLGPWRTTDAKWGGEDNDFIGRYRRGVGLDRIRTRAFHLWHAYSDKR